MRPGGCSSKRAAIAQRSRFPRDAGPVVPPWCAPAGRPDHAAGVPSPHHPRGGRADPTPSHPWPRPPDFGHMSCAIAPGAGTPAANARLEVRPPEPRRLPLHLVRDQRSTMTQDNRRLVRLDRRSAVLGLAWCRVWDGARGAGPRAAASSAPQHATAAGADAPSTSGRASWRGRTRCPLLHRDRSHRRKSDPRVRRLHRSLRTRRRGSWLLWMNGCRGSAVVRFTRTRRRRAVRAGAPSARPGETAIEAFVLIKLLDAEKLLGALEVQVAVLEKELRDEWDDDEDE